MSKNNRTDGRDRVRHRRTARQRAVPTRIPTHPDQRVLGQLPYQKGHLTEQELTCFETLRGALTPDERAELHHAAQTLRRVTKRLRALDLIRYWGAPLSESERLVLPLLAGSSWQRTLPDTPGQSPEKLAHHLLFRPETPRFLLHPFAHPQHYPRGPLRWDMARIAAVVGTGEGLAKLRELENFWTWVPEHVFSAFLQTPDAVPVAQGLVAAFVEEWGGPGWVAAVVYCNALPAYRGVRTGLPRMLRVAHSLCIHPVPQTQAAVEVERLLNAQPKFTCLFGQVPASGLTGQFPDAYSSWEARELRTPEDFEQADRTSMHYLTLYFQDAVVGRICLWELRGDGRSVLVQVDMARGFAYHFDAVRRQRDEQALRVIAAWAEANGLQT